MVLSRPTPLLLSRLEMDWDSRGREGPIIIILSCQTTTSQIKGLNSFFKLLHFFSMQKQGMFLFWNLIWHFLVQIHIFVQLWNKIYIHIYIHIYIYWNIHSLKQNIVSITFICQSYRYPILQRPAPTIDILIYRCSNNLLDFTLWRLCIYKCIYIFVYIQIYNY